LAQGTVASTLLKRLDTLRAATHGSAVRRAYGQERRGAERHA